MAASDYPKSRKQNIRKTCFKMFAASFIYQPSCKSFCIFDRKNNIKSLYIKVKKTKIIDIKSDFEKKGWLLIKNFRTDNFLASKRVRSSICFIVFLSVTGTACPDKTTNFHVFSLRVFIDMPKKLSEWWAHFVNLISIQFLYHGEPYSRI